ncbi:MAG: arginine--tRNA ligase [Patescibacteria group bacterium]
MSDYAIQKLKFQILDLVAQAFGPETDRKQLEITVPPDSSLGDLAVPCFYFSKLSRRSPNQIALELEEKIHPGGVIKSIKAVGPYLNFFIDAKIFGREAIKEIIKKKEKYGQLALAAEKIMLEYSQPNTHKEFHIGHLRNAVLGASLVNVLRFSGYKVVPVNYIGDIGAHVAKCLWALNRFHKDEKPPENKGKYLGVIYSEAVRKTEANPEFKKEADEVLMKLEHGDKYFIALWKKTREWSLDEFNEIYKLLGVSFKRVFFESEVEKPGKKIVSELLEKNIAEKSDGAVIVNLEKYGLKNFILLKSDGSSLYSTKDLALAKLKFQKYKIEASLVVTDSRQNFYFEQLFKTLELIGFNPSDKHGAGKKLVHIPYEFVTLKEGAMSSRSGNVVLFEDFYAQVLAQSKAETKKRHTDWPDKKIDEVAGKIALAAIKFNLLKVGNSNIIVFDIDEALSFDGFSGPYIQYTTSRIMSVLKKAKFVTVGSADFGRLKEELEKELILKIAEFPEAVKEAAENYQPSEVAKYLFELSHLFANFYQEVPILSAEEKTRYARLALCAAVRQVLVNGLELLGIDALEEM